MRTPLPRARTETWTAEIVDPDGNRSVLPLDADQPGRLTWDGDGIDAVVNSLGTPPDFMSDQRIELTLTVNGQRHKFPPLVPVKDDPVIEQEEWYSLHLIDETIILAADGLDFAQVLPAGTAVVAAMKQLAQASAPDLHITWPTLDHTLRNDVELALSSAPLAGINTLAESINALKLGPRIDGGLAMEPWVPPNLRAKQMIFGAGQLAGYEPRVNLQRFYLEAPNVVHYTATGSSSSDRIVGRWRDLDPLSPYSIPRRRRRILATGSGEAATQAIADEQARRVGVEARGRGRTATIRGGWQPVIPYDVIGTEHPDKAALRADWEVLSMSVVVGGEASDTDWSIKEVI